MTTPGQPAPDEAFVVGSRYGQDITEESADELVRGTADDAYNDATDQFRGNIMDGFGNIGDVLGGVRDAVTGIGAGAHQALEDILSHTNGVDSDIGDLQSRTQALEGVIGYINTYCSGGFSMSAGDMFIPMNVQVGPSVGVVYSGNTVYLASKGLWVADVNMNIDYLNIGTVYTNAQVRVYAPNGSLHAQRIMESDTGKRHSLSCHLPFVVPSSGYYVQVWANAALGRGFKGGSIWNGLSVEKRSSETS